MNRLFDVALIAGAVVALSLAVWLAPMLGIATVLFALAAGFSFWVLIGYPIALGILARIGDRPVRKAPLTTTVTAVIAVNNGERFLEDKIRSILDADYPPELLDIIVVSDGSTDATESIARRFLSPRLQLMTLPRGGKCAALNASIAVAKGELLLLTDVRQEIDPGSVRLLVNCFADPAVGVVSGELVIRKGDRQDQADVGLYWRFETWIRDQLGRIDSMFGATGPFYMMRRELAVFIPPDTLLDDMYLPLAAFHRGFRLIVESKAQAFDYPTTRDTEFKRKVRTLAGNYQLLRDYPWLLTFSNRLWAHFLSYKIGRLMLPHALIVLLITSALLPQPWLWIALLPQLGLYALAALDPWMPSGFVLQKLSSPARTFVTMMVAAVVALRVFFVPPRSLWKETKIAFPTK